MVEVSIHLTTRSTCCSSVSVGHATPSRCRSVLISYPPRFSVALLRSRSPSRISSVESIILYRRHTRYNSHEYTRLYAGFNIATATPAFGAHGSARSAGPRRTDSDDNNLSVTHINPKSRAFVNYLIPSSRYFIIYGRKKITPIDFISRIHGAKAARETKRVQHGSQRRTVPVYSRPIF